MAVLAVQNITRAGVTATMTAAAGGGDSFTAGRRTFLQVVNNGGGSITITFATPGTILGDIPVDDLAVSVGAGVRMMIGPFPPDFFADSAGLAQVTYSGVTSVLVGVFALQQP